jgi:hypothetical protein
MIPENIEEQTEVGQRTDVREVDNFKIPRDENGKPIGRLWKDVRYDLEQELSEATGIDFHKIQEMKEAGLLDVDEVTDEMLLSPEFKYEPYPGFKPKPKPEN